MPQPKLDIAVDDEYELFLARRRRDIVARLCAAASRAGRDASEVGMLAVSKTVEPEAVLRAWRAGWRAFAENRPQELSRKLAFVEGEALPEMAGARFDAIGNLQKNKINQVIGKVGLLHSVSSADLAAAVSSRCEARAAAESLAALPAIRVRGLMTMAPRGDADAARRTFSGLRELARELEGRTGLELPVLSCGMSDDFEVAVEEGSTLVRLGRIVFDPAYALA